MKITVPIEIDAKRINDLLCAGYEGGIRYWCAEVRVDREPADPVDYLHEYPMAGGVLSVRAGDDEEWHRVDRAAIEKALVALAEDQPYHFGEFMRENEDAETGDVFWQLVALGEVVYG